MSEQDPGSLDTPPADPGTPGAPGAGTPPHGGGDPTPTPPPDPNAWPDDVPANIRDAVQKRIDAMTARNKGLEERLAQYESRPAQPPASPGGEKPEAPFSGYETWKSQALGNDPKAIALFDGFQQAIMADLDRAVVGYVASQLDPLRTGFQASESDAFYRANPTALAKKREIEAEIQAIPGLTREKAFKIVTFGAAQPNRPQKLPPPGHKPGAPGAPSTPQDLPRGKGIGAMVQAVAESKGL